MRRMTQRALARELGLDFKTVSRGLAGHPDVAVGTATMVREAAAAAGFELPPLWEPVKHETRAPHVVDDDRVAVEGKYLGRFSFNGADWLPAANGTHDGYVYRLGFYCLEREAA